MICSQSRTLAKRFAEISDAQHAFMLLRQVIQEWNENVQVYVERLLYLTQQAYEGAQLQMINSLGSIKDKSLFR
jgi:hypothetical protein